MHKKITVSSNKTNLPRLGEVIKLGIDVHASVFVVAMKIDGSKPQRAKRLSPARFHEWVHQLKQQCDALYSCYEAGPFGYGLHRWLTASGVTNYVICPINWDERNEGVKTDARDALQMVLCLDGYLRGNDRSFSVVRVPTEQEERKRSLVRRRQQLVKDRGRHAAQGRSEARYYGLTLRGRWWKPGVWRKLQEQLPPWFIEHLEQLRELLLKLDELVVAVDQRLAQLEVDTPLPKGMGVVIFQNIEREVCDWQRFKNRKQISSYTGLCPKEDTSSKRRFQGSVNKHGNPRLRHMLVECAWLLLRWNPNYHAIQKRKDELERAALTKASKKKIVVAIARQFAVDWWRIRTGQVTPAQLGLETT